MIYKEIGRKLKNIKGINNKGFSLMEMLVVIFLLSIVILGIQYTLIVGFKNVDQITSYSTYQGAPQRNFQFIKNTILRNQRSENGVNHFAIINGGTGMRMKLDNNSNEYAYIMLSNAEGREDELYYLVSPVDSKVAITEADIDAGKALLLARNMKEIRFQASSDGLLTLRQVFTVDPYGFDDPNDPSRELIDIKEIKLYIN